MICSRTFLWFFVFIQGRFRTKSIAHSSFFFKPSIMIFRLKCFIFFTNIFTNFDDTMFGAVTDLDQPLQQFFRLGFLSALLIILIFRPDDKDVGPYCNLSIDTISTYHRRVARILYLWSGIHSDTHWPRSAVYFYSVFATDFCTISSHRSSLSLFTI